jgi:hypothetical protein
MSKRYGYEHRRRRKQVARSVEAGLAHCARCGLPIEAGSLWDLGHSDLGPGYAGPEHRRCNRATAGRGVAEKVAARSVIPGGDFPLPVDKLW